MASIKMGEQSISKLMMGETEVKKAYMGEILVYEVGSSGGSETWVLNEIISADKSDPQIFEIDFISNKINFNSLEWSTPDAGKGALLYREPNNDYPVYAPPWADETFRTIILAKPATDKLLAWLQANATKQ